MATATAYSPAQRQSAAQLVNESALLNGLVVTESAKGECDLEFSLSRQQVLTYLVKLHRALDNRVWDLAETLLQKFCQSLSHYLTVGHQQTFAIASPIAHQYVAVASTSREIMRFADQYQRQPNSNPVDLPQVYEQLEQLALTLETRFELEDQLRLGLSD